METLQKADSISGDSFCGFLLHTWRRGTLWTPALVPFHAKLILLATLLLHTEGTPIPLVETREVDSSAAGKLPKVSSLADLSRARSISEGLLLKRAD